MRRIPKLLAEFHNFHSFKMFWLPKVGTVLCRAGSIPALAISRGFSMGILLSRKGAWFHHLDCAPKESIAKFGKAADCKSVTVGSNPTTFFSVNISAEKARYLLVVYKLEK